MSTLRRISIARRLEDMASIIPDIQNNFDQLVSTVPQLEISTPPVGEIRILALQADGTWTLWKLIAGAGVSFVQDNVAHTLTVKAP